MKKNLRLIMFFIISMFVFNGRTLALTCTYSNKDTYAEDKYEISFDIDASGKITKEYSFPVSNTFSRLDFKNINKCPFYAYLYKSHLYIGYDYEDMLAEAAEKKAIFLNSVTVQEDKSSVYSKIDTELNSLKSLCTVIASKKYNYAVCYESPEKKEDCKKEYFTDLDYRMHQSRIGTYIYDGLITKSYQPYVEMNDACTAAETNLKKYSNALKYDSCNEYKQATNSDIKCGDDDETSYNNGEVAPFQLCNPDENPEVVVGFRIAGIFITIIKIIVPIVLVVMGMIDLSKAVAEGKDDSLKKSLISFLNRVIAGILIFFVPSIMLALYKFIDGWDNVRGKYETCLQCLLGDSECPDVKLPDEYRNPEK